MSIKDLSAREKQFYDLAMQLKTAKEIAELLGVEKSTVGWCLTRIYKKIGVSGKYEMFRKYNGSVYKNL
jgi:DNA-binding CsgD family transcriptional regulator